MVPMLVSLYVIAVSISVGLLAAAISKKPLGLHDAFSLGLGSILVGGLVFYERAAFEYYAYLLVFFPLVLMGWVWTDRSIPVHFGFVSDPARMRFLALSVVGVTGLLLITILTRLPVSNFLFEIGDAGSYINSANSLARSGVSTSQFFPLNQILLGLFSSLGGFESTPYGVVFAGFLSIFYAYLFGETFFDDKRWGIAVAFLVAFNVLAMWFSRVPYSETLMLAINFAALSFYVSARKGRAPVLNYILFGLFISLASINRVTGIVWMMLLTMVSVVTAFQDRQQFRQLLPGTVLAILGYLASVYVALRMGSGYYMGWQIKEFIPFIDSRTDLLIFHVVWLAGAVAAVFLALRFNAVLNRLWSGLGAHSGLATALAFIIVIPLAVLVVSSGNEIMGVTFYTKVLNGKWPQDAYFLWNYFTPLSLLLFPVGLIFLFRRKNPFVDPQSLAVWLFAFLFLIIYYARVAYERPHDVYLYWDRYFLSEVFLVFVVVLVAGFVCLSRRRLTSLLVPLFLITYFVYGAVWLAENRNQAYLDGAEGMFEWLEDVVPRENSQVFLDAKYEGRWVFPNIRRSLMIPLSNSFGFDVKLPHATSPFSADLPVPWDAVAAGLDELRNVYVIRARKFDTDRSLELEGGLRADLVAEKTFSIETKSHAPGDIFDREYRSFPLHLDVYRIKDNAIVPAEVESSGFYGDNMWTDGNGQLRGFDRCSEEGFTSLRMKTAGNHPWWRDPDRIAVKISVNGSPVTGEWISGTEYVAKFHEAVACIGEVHIASSTFVPRELGINDDGRQLGIDIVRLKPEE